jgi:predicted Zn-dependent protease
MATSLIDALPREERESKELRMVRARLLLKVGREDEGVKELERLQAGDPGDAALGLELAAVHSSLGRIQAALDVLARVKPFVTSAYLRSIIFQREGDLWASQERWTRALDSYRTASHLEPARADLHYRMADLFERMGSPGSAIDELRRGRTLDSPEGAKAREAWLIRLEGLGQ